MDEIYDIAIVGSGPVGQHAALKAALLHMKVVVIDKGRRHSRAFFVPRINNIPGNYGISGRELLNQQREEMKKYPENIHILENTEVTAITRPQINTDDKMDGLFFLECMGESPLQFSAKTVILATGVVDRQPEIGGTIRTILPYADVGLVMYCMLCDGHIIKGKDIAVLGHDAHAAAVASDLKWFLPSSVTLLSHGKPLDEETTRMISDNGIPVIEEEISGLSGLKEGRFGAVLKSGAMEFFDYCFVALGWYEIRSTLGLSLGGHADDEGFLVTNEDCQLLNSDETPIDRLFAVGDVRNTWNQIPIGWGDSEKAVVYIWANYM